MNNYANEYQKLNEGQRKAVDTIEGPLLVIAGPGTGKTQLLSARVARILEQTDTLPQNILCLTFTETGAANMRERLTRFIGQSAYDVQIGTYHSFGGDLIRRFPAYFMESRLQNPVDALGQHQILAAIVEQMSYRNPLKQTQHHLSDLISTVSEVKRALLSPSDLRKIAAENSAFINEADRQVREIFDGFTSMGSFAKAYPYFEALLPALRRLRPTHPVNEMLGSLANIAVEELTEALAAAGDSRKTATLTAWKNNWLAKDSDNKFVFAGRLQNERIIALATVCEQYQTALEQRGWYDFDDMILRSIEALEAHDDFRFTLQEQYQYLLLDEFQDTNAAQLRLVQLLTDNPVHEGRPNVMAVGDDDQAIYAFQGARYSNMLDFYEMFRDVNVVNLTENYRSHADILSTAHTIARQIDSRLEQHFEGMTKVLTAVGRGLPTRAEISRNEFLSDIAQYAWVAEKIRSLIAHGTRASEIAVLAPKHRYIEPLVAYLNDLAVPVRYDKREDILQTPIVQQILQMARLVQALARGKSGTANALWPQVLSFPFWHIPVSAIWRVSWRVSDEHTDWSHVVLSEPATREAGLLILALAHRVDMETCEIMLDFLIGTNSVDTNETDIPTVASPLRTFYTNQEHVTNHPGTFYDALSHLTVLRAKLREHQALRTGTLTLSDLLELVDLYENAGERMLNTSPYSQADDAVQLMTVFKSKGLEFEHVFLLNCHDDVWGSSSRGSANRLTLPANLVPIRHAGGSDDERLRALFVAVTRAKFGLYLTSYQYTFAGKLTKPLKYLDEQEQADGSRHCMVLPEHARPIIHDRSEKPALELLAIDWRSNHLEGLPNTQLRQLLDDRLKRYQLSPTHLNSFVDVIYGGPQAFFFNTLLRFPQSPTINGQFGNAIHSALEWTQLQLNETGVIPSESRILSYFADDLQRRNMTEQQIILETERGQDALKAYLAERADQLKPGNIAEYDFRNQGVFVGDVHMGGKIDLIEIDKSLRTITVVDYKTGGSYTRWQNDAKLHKYRQQLYAYKLLIEGSNEFAGYTVTSGRLEFIEPDSDGKINNLTLTFDSAELKRTAALMQAMWRKVQALDMPTIDTYSKDLKGIQAFEDDLLNED